MDTEPPRGAREEKTSNRLMRKTATVKKNQREVKGKREEKNMIIGLETH